MVHNPALHKALRLEHSPTLSNAQRDEENSWIDGVKKLGASDRHNSREEKKFELKSHFLRNPMGFSAENIVEESALESGIRSQQFKLNDYDEKIRDHMSKKKNRTRYLVERAGSFNQDSEEETFTVIEDNYQGKEYPGGFGGKKFRSIRAQHPQDTKSNILSAKTKTEDDNLEAKAMQIVTPKATNPQNLSPIANLRSILSKNQAKKSHVRYDNHGRVLSRSVVGHSQTFA